MRLAIVAALGGCGFQVGAGSADDGVVRIDAAGDAAGDGPDGSPDGPSIGICALPKIWEADFSGDPRALDVNGDGTPDWAIRAGNPMPGVVAGGVWTESVPPQAPLDTQPKQNFDTPTKVHVRMQNDVVGPGYGAVFWINVGYGDTMFAPIWMDLALQANATESLTLYTKDPAQTPIILAGKIGLAPGMHDMTLTINPAGHTVHLQIDALPVIGPLAYTEIPVGGSDDRFATITAFSTTSEFDLVRVEVCP